jgi:transcriptional regulator with XRE-family HTH domain
MTTLDQVILGRALRDLRARAELTQADMAARAETSNTYVSRLEIGQRDIRWSTVLRLLNALDADLHQLADAIAEVEKQDRAAKQ